MEFRDCSCREEAGTLGDMGVTHGAFEDVKVI